MIFVKLGLFDVLARAEPPTLVNDLLFLVWWPLYFSYEALPSVAGLRGRKHRSVMTIGGLGN